MTPKHTKTERPALSILAGGRAFAFQRSADRAAPGAHAVALEIHNVNALDLSEQKRVHIMNFLVADQSLLCGIHIMNSPSLKQVEPPSIRWKPVGAGQAGTPSTHKGARNVMS